jgi:hypothetical protein
MSAVPSAVQPGGSQQAVAEAALVLLERMGLSPADLVAAPREQKSVPTFAEYVPVGFGGGERRRLDEPTPSEIRQLMTWVKAHVVACLRTGHARLPGPWVSVTTASSSWARC